jgi:multidrug efflux pump
MKKIEEIALATEGVEHAVAISGQSILLGANASNFGSIYLMLKPFEERRDRALSADRLAARLQEDLQQKVPNAVINIFGAPPVEGLGTAGGFKIIVQDTGDAGLLALQKAADGVVEHGDRNPMLQDLFCSFRADTPWLELVVDRPQAKDRGVSIDDIRSTLESTFGSYYINDFNLHGRTWQVNVQSLDRFRQSVEDVKQLKVRSNTGDMVPMRDFAEVRYVNGPVMVTRYNMYQAAAIHADAGPYTSSGQAIAELEDSANDDLPQSMRTEWTELAYLQLQTGSTAMWVFVLAVVLVFLVLAAQYESWALPLAVILVVPMCLLCAIAGVRAANSDINIFTQIGFLVLVGLACKNAILIVEFAKAQREAGVDRRQATLDACQLRLRPIIMTSFAFILGVVPLMLSEGAGAEMRQTLGTAVFSGMLGVTLFGVFLTPVFYYVIQWFSDLRPPGPLEPDDYGMPASHHGHAAASHN